MKTIKLIAHAAVIGVSALWLSGSAFAFCGTVSASATAGNQNQAMAMANAQGQRETNALDRQYGGSVKYQPARWFCVNASGGMKCKISQGFCVSDASPGGGGGNVDPNTPQCKKWLRKCNNGSNSSCAKYENNCQND